MILKASKLSKRQKAIESTLRKRLIFKEKINYKQLIDNAHKH